MRKPAARMFSHPVRFLCTVFALLTLTASAPAQVDDFVRLSQEKAAENLQAFRNYRLSGDFCFQFVIIHQQRRGDEETRFNGKMWGTWGKGGPLFRVEIQQDGKPTSPIHRFLLQSGPQPELWIVDAQGNPVRSKSAAQTPLFPGLIFTPFELQTPFSYWPEARYLRTVRFKGRPTHLYRMTPPADFQKANPGISYVQLGFDRTYNALMQAVIFDAKEKPLRYLEAESFAKVQEQYIPEEIRLRDAVTRDRDLFRVTAAALNLRLDRAIFTPEALHQPAPLPAAEFFTTID